MDYLWKLIGATQASCVFFSAFSIVLIAVDRFIFIVHPTSTQISTAQVNLQEGFSININQNKCLLLNQALILSAVSLFMSAFLSSPLFFVIKSKVQMSFSNGVTYSYCYEVKKNKATVIKILKAFFPSELGHWVQSGVQLCLLYTAISHPKCNCRGFVLQVKFVEISTAKFL